MAVKNPNASKVITGGRAVVSIDGTVIGIFDSVSVSESLGVEDVHTLGADGPREIAVTSQNSVKVQCSGFRVYGAGVRALGKYPTLNSLLNLGPVVLTIADREQDAKSAPMATIAGCIPDSSSNNYQSRATSKINITYTGMTVTEEGSGADGEDGSSPGWPS